MCQAFCESAEATVASWSPPCSDLVISVSISMAMTLDNQIRSRTYTAASNSYAGECIRERERDEIGDR